MACSSRKKKPPPPAVRPNGAHPIKNLKKGLAAGFINAYAPECDARNEQTLWILVNIKAEQWHPIAGWPEAKVRHMSQKQKERVGKGNQHDPVPSHNLQSQAVPL